MHKNNNDAVGNFAIYEIIVNEKRYKIGKADYDRIKKNSGDPTRIHQQLRILRKKYEVDSVFHQIIETMIGVTTKHAKEFEKQLLINYYKIYSEIPIGNIKSFKPE